MSGQIVNLTWIPEVPIIRGVDWGSSTGHVWTADQDISNVVFEVVLKRGTATIVTLTEGNSMITHSGTYAIKLKIPKATTATLSQGAVKGDLIGTISGVSTYYGSIETQIR